jgi:hypothetical protein
MRIVFALALAAVVAGCGATHAAQQRTFTRYVTETVGDAGDPLAKRAVPPLLRLHARAGVQRAVQGSSCVNYTDPKSGEGTGVCSDTPFPTPRRLSVVRPGEHVRFELAGNRGFAIDVRSLGCVKHALTTFRVGRDGRWTVALRPGLYALVVHVRNFRIGARDGDTSGGVGLWVSRRHVRRLVPAASVYAPGCG